MIDAAFIRTIAELAQGALKPAVIKTANEEVLVGAGGVVLDRTPLIERRSHVFSALDAFPELDTASYWMWLDGSHLRAAMLYHDADRRDRATFAVGPTKPAADFAAYVSGGTWFSQRDFVRLLRVALAGCVANPALASCVASVKWTAGAVAEGEVKHGRESISRDLKAEVLGVSAIPEEVAVSLRAWDGLPFMLEFNCAVEVDVQNQRFRLTPLGDAFDDALYRAYAGALAMFGEIVGDVIAGSPE